MKNTITMKGLQHLGRGVNQCFRYMFLEKYARKHRAELQLPSWVGNTLFGFENPPIIAELPTYRESGGGTAQPSAPLGNELVNHDFVGHAQYHTSYFSSERLHIRKVFQPTREVYQRLVEASVSLVGEAVSVIGIHLRRGDYGRRIFPLVPVKWYMTWLRHHVPRLGRVKLFIATEDPSMIDKFCTYDPWTAKRLGVEPQEQSTQSGDLPHDVETSNLCAADWYPDFYLLSQCDIILGGSSTFSFFAAMLNPLLQEYWRASLRAETFVQTDPWNAFPLLREHCRDYPHLKGITSKDNPYW